MAKMSRTKGHSFERFIAASLRGVFPHARRHLENHEEDAARGADLIFTGRYRIQCKRGRKWAAMTAIEEVKADEFFDEVPVLITKGDNKRILVCLPFEEFLRLIMPKRS